MEEPTSNDPGTVDRTSVTNAAPGSRFSWLADGLKRDLPGCRVLSFSHTMQPLRRIKDPTGELLTNAFLLGQEIQSDFDRNRQVSRICRPL